MHKLYSLPFLFHFAIGNLFLKKHYSPFPALPPATRDYFNQMVPNFPLKTGNSIH